MPVNGKLVAGLMQEHGAEVTIFLDLEGGRIRQSTRSNQLRFG